MVNQTGQSYDFTYVLTGLVSHTTEMLSTLLPDFPAVSAKIFSN